MRLVNARKGMSLLAGIAVCACLLDTAAGSDPPAPPDDSARLLVIAPRVLAAAMEPLVAAKNATKMPARLVVIETLPKDSGRDDAERVKRAIVDAHERHGTRYVLLAGDASLFPVRFRKVTQVPADAYLDCTYNPTDLYYANLYRDHAPGADAADPAAIGHSAAFDDWDANADDAFGEQHWANDAVSFNPDRVDGCPDVAVGRLPAHTPEEAAAYVAKVIRYEATPSLFRNRERFTFVADRNYDGSTRLCNSIIQGGVETGFRDPEVGRLLANRDPGEDTPDPWENGAFSKIDFGLKCTGWVVYVGHAGARAWAIRENGRCFDADHVAKLDEGEKEPVVFTVGCETGRFMCWAPSERYLDCEGVTREFAWHAAEKTWTDVVAGKPAGPRLVVPRPGAYDRPDARDRSFAGTWLFADAGAIVYAGESLTCPNDLGAELVRDVLARGPGESAVLGEMWLQGQRRYWLDNRASEGVFRSPRVFLGIMTLFGDPSLRLQEGE